MIFTVYDPFLLWNIVMWGSTFGSTKLASKLSRRTWASCPSRLKWLFEVCFPKRWAWCCMGRVHLARIMWLFLSVYQPIIILGIVPSVSLSPRLRMRKHWMQMNLSASFYSCWIYLGRRRKTEWSWQSEIDRRQFSDEPSDFKEGDTSPYRLCKSSVSAGLKTLFSSMKSRWRGSSPYKKISILVALRQISTQYPAYGPHWQCNPLKLDIRYAETKFPD